MLKTPVALLIFNRPEVTRRVFHQIARARPTRLLVVADGPRSDEEAERCAAARSIVDEVDWHCELLTNFSSHNLGCRLRVSSGLDWVFDLCDEAIVLEDDCLPHETFFPYCSELLGRYRDDERVMAIAGTNPLLGKKQSPYSYYFSWYNLVWGWATWRRAWKSYYDVDMTYFDHLRNSPWLETLFAQADAAAYWQYIFDRQAAGLIDTWDYQWFFACWSQHGACISPEVNLVSNIGSGDSATHTRDALPVMGMDTQAMPFPLVHPPVMVIDRAADRLTFEHTCPWAVHQPLRRLRHATSRLRSRRER